MSEDSFKEMVVEALVEIGLAITALHYDEPVEAGATLDRLRMLVGALRETVRLDEQTRS